MQTKPTRCNVIILPPKEISKKAILASRKLKKHGGLFILNNKSHLPHITLYATDVPYRNLNIMAALLRRELTQRRRVSLRAAPYHQKKNGFVEVGFKRTTEILSLHKSLIRLLNPLREGMEAHRERFAEFGRKERANIIRYGYPEADALFRPHITFTRLEPQSRNKNILAFLQKEDFSFTAKSIGFFLAGAHGTCRKMIAKFNLR